MITVRFPTGFSVQYNNANYVDWPATRDHVHLYERKVDGKLTGWVATAPLTAIIEIERACRTYDGNTQPGDDLLDEVLRRIEDQKQRPQLSCYRLAKIKMLLRALNARTYCWTD